MVLQAADMVRHVIEGIILSVPVPLLTFPLLNENIGHMAALQLYQLSYCFNSCFVLGISNVDFFDCRLWTDPV